MNITDITDESGYIEAIGRKAASEAIQQAEIDVAEQQKKGAIGVAEAERERAVEVANAPKVQTIGTREADRERRNGQNGTSSTARWLHDMSRTLPPMLQVMKDVGGIEIPQTLAQLAGAACESNANQLHEDDVNSPAAKPPEDRHRTPPAADTELGS